MTHGLLLAEEEARVAAVIREIFSVSGSDGGPLVTEPIRYTREDAMHVRPQDLRAIAIHRSRSYRPARDRLRRRRLPSIWRQLVEAWNVRPRPRLSH